MLQRHGTRLEIGTAEDVAELDRAEATRRAAAAAAASANVGGGPMMMGAHHGASNNHHHQQQHTPAGSSLHPFPGSGGSLPPQQGRPGMHTPPQHGGVGYDSQPL